MKHTQGPWIAATQLDSEHITDVSGVCSADGIHITYVSGYGNTREQNFANARLISAAPDLLAALQSIATTAGLCAITFPNAPGNGDLQAIVREARLAIAKATA